MEENGQVDIFVRTLAGFWERVADLLTTLVMAVAVVVIGFVLAKLARSLVSKLLKFAKFDGFVEKSGLESFLSASPHPVTMSGILGGIVYILIILMTLGLVADMLDLTIASHLVEQVVLYLPKVILAVFILVFGVVFSRFINNFVFGLLKGMKVSNALMLSTICEYLVQVFVWFFALEQVLETQLLLVAFSILFGALCLAGAIAFGLAGRKQAEKWLDKGIGQMVDKAD